MARSLALFVFFLFVFVGFFIKGSATADPDFGWHIKTGELIQAQGIPQNDPFSYTMPSYHFVDHEWLSDVLSAKAYDAYGLLPLQILFALLGVGSLIFLFAGTEKKWAFTALFLVAGTIFDFTGVRMQVFTWLFLGIEVAILFEQRWYKKFCFFLPLLFLVWANLHGGFAIGLAVLTIFLVGKRIEEKKFLWQDYVVLIFCFGLTLLNPYGYNLWIEVSKSFTDTSLRFAIQEWYPAVYFTNIAFWIYFMISVVLVLRYWKKFSKTMLFLYFLLLISGLASMRNLPVFVIVSFYPTMQAVTYLAREAGKFPFGKERFEKAYVFFFIMSLCLYFPQLGAFFYGISQNHGDSPYPSEAVAYLKENLPVQNIFAPYDWGGYLIWKLPEKKEFIDGRMPSWRNPQAPRFESQYAFGDYKNILTNPVQFEKISDQYGIDTVLVPAGEVKKKKVYVLGIDVDKNNFLKRYFTKAFTFTYLPEELRKNGWKIVYQDKKVVIFRKPDIGS